jgi:hypothetical protein
VNADLPAAPPGAPPAPSSPVAASPFTPPAVPSATKPSGPDWGAAVNSFLGDQQAKATGNVVAAQGSDPDKVALARTLAPVLGVPATAMESDPSFWQQQFQTQANQATIGTDANLQKWIADDPANAKLASDDIPQLGLIGRLADSFGQGFNQASLQSKIGELGFSEQTHTASPQQMDLLQTFKEQAGAQPAAQSGIVPAAGRFLGGTAQMFANALPEAAAGAATGGALGLPEGGVGAIPGAIGGAALGLTAGIAGQTGIQTSGQTYDTLSDLKDKYGRPIPEATKQAASVFAGVASAALAGVGGDVLSAPVKALVPSLVHDVAVEAATRPTLNRALSAFAASAVKAGVTGAVVNGSMTAAQLIAPQVAEAITSPDFQTVFNDPEQRRQMVGSIVDSMEQGAAAFPLFELPMRGLNLYADMARADAATDNAQQWAGLQDEAGASKTRQRAPDAFSSLMALHAADGNVDSIYVPAERLAELYQGIQTRPGAPEDPFSFVPDLQAQFERGLLTGGDVEIPTADFTAHLAGTDIERALRPDIRFAPDGFTLREAMDFKNSNMEPVSLEGLTDEDAGDVGVDHRGQAIQAVQDDITDQLRRAGFTPDVAAQYSALLGARYGARGDDFAQSPFDLYKAEGIQVQRGEAARVGPGNYTGVDEVIDSLRRGDKQPTDKQLYGPSLLEYLSGGAAEKRGAPGAHVSGAGQREAAGGLRDETGDLKAMGAAQWHRGKPGRRKLLNPNGMRLDEAAARAHEAGYFSEHTEVPDVNDLLDAIHDELSGDKRYIPAQGDAVKQEQFRSVSQQLEQFLDERGIDIKTASNAEIKAALDAAREPEPTFEQSAPAGARGSITLGDGQRIIRMFKGADKSTFLHEMGHQFLDEMLRDAERDDAPQSILDDAATVRKWLGLKDDEYPGVNEHEKFAGGFETYLMEGKAPSMDLRLAFQKFAAWLTRIYRTITGIGVPINNDIRGVMDRLLATDDAIAEARGGLAIKNPLFRTAKDAGMTVGEFAAYTGMIRKAESSMYDRVLRRAMRVETLRRKKEWRDAAAEARPEIEAQVKGRPALQAWYALRYGKDILNPDNELLAGKIDIDAARDILGNSFARLPRDIVAKDGTHPDALAPAFGYSSGEEMLRDLVNENVGREEAAAQQGKPVSLNKYISQMVDQAMDAHLEQRFGDPLNDGTLEEVAQEAAHNESQRDVLAAEMRQLGKIAGEPPPYSIKQVEAWARSNLADTAINKATRVAMFRRAEAQAGKDAERYLLAKRPIEAFKAKQRQMIAHAFATEADRLQKEWTKTTTYWRNIAKSATRPGTAQPYLDQVHGILDRLGMTVKRDAGELGRALQGKPLEGFVQDKAADGYDLVVPDFLLDPRFNGHYQDLTSDQFEAARDAVTTLLRAGRAEEEVTLEGKRVALSDLVDEAVDRMMALPGRDGTPRLRPDRARDVEGVMHMMASAGRSIDASLLKIEQFFSELDSHDLRGAGPFLRMFDRIKEAQHAENDRLEEIAGQWRAMKALMPKDWAKGLRTRFTVPELLDPETGSPISITKDELLGMALNVGNTGPTSNMEKLTRGFGWDPDAVMRVLHQRMGKADWDFVQGVWDIFETMAPDIEEMHRRVTGVGFPRVEANPIETAHGIYRGGYFPIIYDADKARTAKGQETADGLFEKNYFRATTSKGHTISRVEFNAPLRLGLDQIPYKISQAVHDLTHREAIMDAWKFLNAPGVTSAVKRVAGPEYAKLFNPWLRDLANNSNTDDKNLQWMDNAIRRVRLGASAVQIGFRATTVLKHGLSALSNSVGEVGGGELARASRDLYGPHGSVQRAMVMAKSGELRHRMETIDRDARESLKSLMGETTWVQNVQRLGYYPVAAFDMGTAMPTWLAGYRRALAGGLDEQEAINEGDRSVRFAHGSGGAADMAAIQRGPEWTKALTMFYGFFNHMYNRERATVKMAARGVRAARSGDSAGARRDFVAVAGRSLYYLLVPAMVEATISPGPDDANENWLEWGSKAILNQVCAGIPILRDLASSALNGYGYQVTPLQQPVEEVGETAQNIARATGLSDKAVSGRWLQHAIDTVGYATGLPLGQAGTAAQYLWDIGDGDADPQSLGDFLHGLMHGAPRAQ